ncbi:hypothetical protein AB0C24_29595 [Amycolatopsis japonica]|uniref:DUF6959 family protein n=1 Tax=Amycolatopsis japonica TaxID=208439 RepID=UPI0033CD708B
MSDADPVSPLVTRANYALVQVRGRRFPGMVIPGDSLRQLEELVDELKACVDKCSENVNDVVLEISDYVGSLVCSYESMMKEVNVELPYFRE